MIRSIRESLSLYTRFDTGDGFFKQYARSILDVTKRSGVSAHRNITLSETHTKLIAQAQEQNILHKDIGLVRALRLEGGLYYYDVVLRSIDGGLFSRGTSLRLDEAVARAFGELYERISMRFVPARESVTYASCRELENKNTASLKLTDLPQATQAQKEVAPEMYWSDESVFGWVEAHNIYTNEAALIPAQLAHWGYRRREDEPLLGQISTHGLGAGYTPEEALTSASSELVQRHSFFSYWYAFKAPPKIDVESVLRARGTHPYIKKLIGAVRTYGLDIHLLDCTLPSSTPSVAVVLTRAGLGWVVGMSTSTSYEKAIERGLCEALSTYVWTMNTVQESESSVFDEKEMPSGFCDRGITDRARVLWWSEEKTAAGGSFFLTGKERSFEELPVRGVTSVEALRHFSKGQAFVRYAKQPYLEQAGFHSVMTIAPHMYRLALHETMSTPVLHGIEPKNRYPHPFP
ncbi:YcaO-like family protein [Candidatus Kaiserbacteria bacterium]|nr:YcaO-like family protein [Candidatus Kaiserbacteria bacterium]